MAVLFGPHPIEFSAATKSSRHCALRCSSKTAVICADTTATVGFRTPTGSDQVLAVRDNLSSFSYQTNNSEIMAVLLDKETKVDPISSLVVNTINFGHVKNPKRTPFLNAKMANDIKSSGVGPDLVIESAGDPEAFIEALKMVRKGGTVIEVGNWVDTGKTVPLNVMQHIASKNVHIHSVFHCGSNWRPVLSILKQQSARYPFASLISHRMGLDELVAKMGVVTNPNECVKVQVVPHGTSR